MKVTLWILFIAFLFIMGSQGAVLQKSGHSILDLELSNNTEGIQILQLWHKIPYGDLNLLDVARSNTQWDFGFIVLYVFLMMTLSNWQMQRESYLLLNELIRFNFLLVFIAGTLDIIENFRLLHNFHHTDINYYQGTYWIALSKFVLLGIAIFILIISFFKTTFKST